MVINSYHGGQVLSIGYFHCVDAVGIGHIYCRVLHEERGSVVEIGVSGRYDGESASPPTALAYKDLDILTVPTLGKVPR